MENSAAKVAKKSLVRDWIREETFSDKFRETESMLRNF
jgi:hypothetical protein